MKNKKRSVIAGACIAAFMSGAVLAGGNGSCSKPDSGCEFTVTIPFQQGQYYSESEISAEASRCGKNAAAVKAQFKSTLFERSHDKKHASKPYKYVGGASMSEIGKVCDRK